MRLTLVVLLLIPVVGIAQTYSDYIGRANEAIDTLQRNGKRVDAKHQAILAALYDSAFAVGKPTNKDLYNAACANSASGNKKRALTYLRQAFENGYDNFDWMYYDRDLTGVRFEPDYLAIEKKYRPDSTVFWFDILRELNASDIVTICDKRISIPDGVYNYSLRDILFRVGADLKLTNDSLIDFSKKTLTICRSKFENRDRSYNSLQRMSIRELYTDGCFGDLVLEKLRCDYLGLYRGDGKLGKLVLDSLTINRLARVYCSGSELHVKNSTFNVDLPRQEEFRWGLAFNVNYDYVTIHSCTFNAAQKKGLLNPFDFDFREVKALQILNSKFNYPTRILGSVADRLVIQNNSFPQHIEIMGLQLPDFDYYFPYSQLDNSILSEFDYAKTPFDIIGDSAIDFQNPVIYDNFTGLYKRLYDHYRARADIASANEVYVLMKELEIDHLESIPNRTTEETIRLRLNQLMGFYTDHATSPGKALIISFYIILVFGIFYCFFPSDWDKTSKSKIITDFRLFIEKNEHGYVKPFFKMMKGLLISLLNALSLSLNAFITLGFGNIPTTGVARYVCVLQGALGWFLLSLFTVALLNQVLL